MNFVKKILLIFLVSLFCAPMAIPPRLHHTWTLSQSHINNTCGANTCTVTGFTAIPAGSVIVGIGFSPSTAQTALAGSSNAGTWTVPSGCTGTSSCAVSDTSGGSAIAEYILSSTGSPTSIIVTITTGSGNLAGAWVGVFSFTSGPPTFDVGATGNDTTCTTCAGKALTPTGNDIIIQYAACGQTCATSATAGFVGATPYSTGAGGDAQFPAGDGAGAAINQSTGTAPNWSQSPTGTMGVGAIAFKEASASSASRGKAIIF